MNILELSYKMTPVEVYKNFDPDFDIAAADIKIPGL